MGCDGQVLVYHDLVGLFDRFTPKFVKRYANIGPIIAEALSSFASEVEDGLFPTVEHTYQISDEEYRSFLKLIEDR